MRTRGNHNSYQENYDSFSAHDLSDVEVDLPVLLRVADLHTLLCRWLQLERSKTAHFALKKPEEPSGLSSCGVLKQILVMWLEVAYDRFFCAVMAKTAC